MSNLATSSNGYIQAGAILVDWTHSDTSISFRMSAPILNISNSSNVYISFALSHDTRMVVLILLNFFIAWNKTRFFKGDDNVAVCRTFSSRFELTTALEHYYNEGLSEPNLLSEDAPSIGFSNIQVRVVNGFLECKFNRLKSMPNVRNYFNLNQSYYILTAAGEVAKEGMEYRLKYHGSARMSSSITINFVNVTLPVLNYNIEYFHKTHSCLMIFSWLFLCSIGSLFAR